jgi:hypothetical protein
MDYDVTASLDEIITIRHVGMSDLHINMLYYHMKQFCYTQGFGYVYDEICSYFISGENQKFMLLMSSYNQNLIL